MARRFTGGVQGVQSIKRRSRRWPARWCRCGQVWSASWATCGQAQPVHRVVHQAVHTGRASGCPQPGGPPGPACRTALQPRRRSRRAVSRAHQALTQLREASSPNAFSHSPQMMFSPGLPHRFTPQLRCTRTGCFCCWHGRSPRRRRRPCRHLPEPRHSAPPSGRSTVKPKLFRPTCRAAGRAKRSHQEMRMSWVSSLALTARKQRPSVGESATELPVRLPPGCPLLDGIRPTASILPAYSLL